MNRVAPLQYSSVLAKTTQDWANNLAEFGYIKRRYQRKQFYFNFGLFLNNAIIKHLSVRRASLTLSNQLIYQNLFFPKSLHSVNYLFVLCLL